MNEIKTEDILQLNHLHLFVRSKLPRKALLIYKYLEQRKPKSFLAEFLYQEIKLDVKFQTFHSYLKILSVKGLIRKQIIKLPYKGRSKRFCYYSAEREERKMSMSIEEFNRAEETGNSTDAIISFLSKNKDKAFQIKEIASSTGLSPSTIYNILQKHAKQGVLKRKKILYEWYYCINTSHPLVKGEVKAW